MSSGKKDTWATFTANGVAAVLALGTQSCLAWVLGPAGRGEYAVCIVFAMMLAISFGLGVEMAVVYYVGSKRLDLSDAVGAGLVWSLLSSVAAIGVGFALVEMPWAFFEKAPLPAFHLSLLLVPINLVMLVLTRALIGLGRLVTFGIVTAARGGLVLLLTLLLTGLLGWGVYGAIWAVITGELLLSVSVLLTLRRGSSLLPKIPSLHALRLVMCYGARFYLGKLGRRLNFQLGTLIVASFATRAELGIFAAATAMMARVWMIPEALNVVLLPRTSGSETGRADLVAKCARVSLLLTLLLLIPALFLAEPLVRVVLSPEFLPAVPLMWILATGVLLRTYPKVLASFFNGQGRPGLMSIAILAGLVVNLALMPILFVRFGLPGAALAMTIAYFVEVLLTIVWFRRMSGVPFTRLWRILPSDLHQLRGFLDRVPRARGTAKGSDR